MRWLLTTGLLLLASCAAPEPLRGVDLPPASLPDEIDPDQWAVGFSHRFGPEFWGEGPHVYRLVLDCPDVVDEPVETDISFFAVRSDAPTFDDDVYLRAAGLSTSRLGPIDVNFVNVAQETAALLTVIGLTQEQVDLAADCEGEVEFDDGQAEPMLPEDPFRP
ncbi:MAG TPA: hypothetical protein VMM14_04495 [Acidimicrobiia bacterium]|nr:hypothetical protein [Acidimicrobiia bacterium]